MKPNNISITEKIGYGLGDTASNLIFQTVMLFLSYFYTDVFGLSAAAVGTMFLVVRLFDGITDPLMGYLTDKFNSVHGKFRPYLVWMAIPFVIACWLTFTTPNWLPWQKLVYAYLTYALLMLIYTAINIPYCALGGVITQDPQQRISLQSYRFTLAMIGGLLVTSCTLPMVEFFGAGEPKQGYQLTMLTMGLIGCLLFFACFKLTRERIHPPRNQQLKLSQSLGALWRNDQWRVISILCFVVLIAMVIRNTVALYYVNYYLQLPSLATQFITLGMIGAIAGSFIAQYLCLRWCKIRCYMIANALAGCVCIGSFFISTNDWVTAIVAHFSVSFLLQVATPLLWSMMADVVDYGEYQSGKRITGLIYSANLFFLKLGMAIGGAFAAWSLAFVNYQAGQPQSGETLLGINLLFTAIPGGILIASAAILIFYRLDRSAMENIKLASKQSNVSPELTNTAAQ